MSTESAPTPYKPSGWYFRKEIRGAKSKEQLRRLALTAVREIELLRDFIREEGMIPPKRNVTDSEAREKGWSTSGGA